MKKIALLTHVYNAQAALDEQVRNWKRLSPQDTGQLEILVVDDCSEEPTRASAEGLPLRLLRITTDIPWNMAGAKNLLRQQSSAPWMLFFDMDNMLLHTEIQVLLAALNQLDPRKLYMFQRIMDGVIVEPHINTFLVHRDVLESVGGFDEDFCGHYGFEDVYFQQLLLQRKVERVLLTNLTFVQGTARTETLNRDLSRNQELIHTKVASGAGTSPVQLRFQWVEQPCA